MEEKSYVEVELNKLEAKEGVRVVQNSHYRDTVAYVFIQDFTDGKRTYGYLIPRENGSSMAYIPQGDIFMKTEAELIKKVAKLARQEMQKEFEEILHGTKE